MPAPLHQAVPRRALADGDTSAHIAAENILYSIHGSTNLTTSTVEYAVGDAVLFNDALCHWVEYSGDTPRFAIILNVDRMDIATWRRVLPLS